MIYVFIIQNKFNNKIYIGQSRIAPSKRKHSDEIAQLVPKSNRLHKIIVARGGSQFTISELEKFKNSSEASAAVDFWIQHFNSMDPEVGYNIVINKKTKKSKNSKNDMEHSNIRKMFLTGDYSLKDLSQSYNINNKSVAQIIDSKGYLAEAEEFDVELEPKEPSKEPQIFMDEFGMEFESIEACADYYNTTKEEIIKKLKNEPCSDKKLPSIFWLKIKAVKKI